MNKAQARKALDLFRAAIELAGAERAQFLERECGSDLELRAEVESLIASDAADWSGLDRPLFAADGGAPLHDSNDLVEPGCVIDSRYRVIERLGEGGMGIVYRAEQDHPRRDVALKVIKSTSTEWVRRFEREVQILARLRHPGIARIYDAGQFATAAGRRSYLAMELVDGESIISYARNRRLDTRARLELLARVCDAIQHAHQAGVIHRDLKPDNIPVEDSADGPRPRILDFGVGALIHHPASTRATQPGCLLGTITYMAPEQISGAAGTQADVYALGIILYELLCGKHPIEVSGLPLAALVMRIQDEPAVPISRHDPRFRGDIETIVRKALEKDPARRYASADALATDLRRYLSHEPILARRPSAAYVVGRFTRRHRLLVGVSLTAILAITATTIAMFFSAMRARDAEQRAVKLAGVLASRALPMLTDQVGTRAQREALADELHTAALALVEHLPDNPVALSVYADSLRQMSRVTLDENDLERTLEFCQRAFAARQRALRASPDDAALRSAQSIDMVLIGDAFKLRNQPERAKSWYREADAVQRALAEQEPSADHLEHLAWSQQRLWHWATEEGCWDDALNHANHLMDLSRRVVALRPGDLTALDALREAHIALALVQIQHGERTAALAHHEQALAIGRNLVASDPHNRLYLRGHLSNLSVGITWYEAPDELPQRRALADEALPLAERFHAADPDDAIAIKVLSRLLARVARIAESEGRSDVAASLVDRQLALYRSQADQIKRANAAEFYSNFKYAAMLYRRLGRDDASRAAWREAQQFLEQDAAQSHSDPANLTLLAEHLLTCEWPELRDPARARELSIRAAALASDDQTPGTSDACDAQSDRSANTPAHAAPSGA